MLEASERRATTQRTLGADTNITVDTCNRWPDVIFTNTSRIQITETTTTSMGARWRVDVDGAIGEWIAAMWTWQRCVCELRVSRKKYDPFVVAAKYNNLRVPVQRWTNAVLTIQRYQVLISTQNRVDLDTKICLTVPCRLCTRKVWIVCAILYSRSSVVAVYIQQVMWNRYRGNIAHRENTIARYWRGKYIG